MNARRLEVLLGVSQFLLFVPAAFTAVFLLIWMAIGGYGLYAMATVDFLAGPSVDWARILHEPGLLPPPIDFDPADPSAAGELAETIVKWITPTGLYLSTWLQNIGFLVPAAGLTLLATTVRRRVLPEPPAFGDDLRAGFALRGASLGQLALGAIGGFVVMWVPMALTVGVDSVAELDNTSSEIISASLAQSGTWEWAFGALTIAIVVPILEELMFRGWLWGILERWLPGSVVWGLTTVLFALAHGSPAHIAGVLFIGAFLGWLRARTGSVWPSVLAHIANNGLGVLLITLAVEPPEWLMVVFGIGAAGLIGGLIYGQRRSL